MKRKIKKVDYRHYICLIITIGFIACGIFIFPNAICRLAESIRDFSISIAYWFCESCNIEHDLFITVNDLPKWQIAESKFQPLTLFPFSLDEFKVLWGEYWRAWISWDTLQGYLYVLFNVLYYVMRICFVLFPFLLIVYLILDDYVNTHNNDYGQESSGLKKWKRLYDKIYTPVKTWIMDIVAFLKEKTYYWKIWLWTWAFYFNFLTILIEFFAFYIYFVVSFDFVDIYRQVYKLLLDLSTVVRFIPVVMWVIIGTIGLELWSHSIGYNNLEHRERKNRGFINERGIVTTIDGVMGAGKTETMTDMGLSGEVELRNRAFEVIVECDFNFPYFPWINLEQALKQATAFHVTYDLSSIRRWVRKKYRRWLKCPCKEKVFGYDYERYGLYHNDKLKIENVWQCIEDYACAYFVYAVQCSLIISNYSVRSDVDCIDFGNFPQFNTDFFHRDPEMMEAFSRRSHILDFDMLRFGKRVLKDNPNRHSLSFGVYLITEIDKERKNDLQNKELKASADEANQKNDLFNPLLKMIRHACVIRNRVFIILLCDLQRPEDWGAGGREVGELIHIAGQGENRPVLPFFAPFWIFEALYLGIFKPFVDLYYRYRAMRGDDTSFIHGTHGGVARLKDWYESVYNTFGCIQMSVEVENGRMDGSREEKQYFKNVKKIRMERYGTACLQGMFEQYAADNTVGIADLDEYADKMASQDELRKQNSYMQNDIYFAQKAA